MASPTSFVFRRRCTTPLATALARSQAQALAHDAELTDRLAAMPTPELRELAGQPAAPARSGRSVERLGHELSRAHTALQKAELRREALELASSEQPAHCELTQARAEEHQSRERHARLLAAHERAHASEPRHAKTSSAETTQALAEFARRQDLAVRRALAAPAPHLEAALGDRPLAPAARRTWERAAARVERYRFQQDVRDPERALGTEPGEMRERAAWRDARRDVDRSRARIAHEPDRVPVRDHGRQLG